MPGWLERGARLSATRPQFSLGLAGLLAVLGAFGAANLEIDPGNEALFLAQDPALGALTVFRDRFGGDEQIIVGVAGEIFTDAGLARLDEMTAALGALAGVEASLSLTTAQNIYQGPVEIFPWAPYEQVLDGDKPPQALRAELTQEPLFVGNLVSSGGNVAAIVLTLVQNEASVVQAVTRTAAELAGPFEIHIAGFPIERQVFSDLIRRDQRRFVPLLLAVIAVVALAFFRQFWGMALPLVVVGLTTVCTLGVGAAVGVRLNAVTSLLTPVIMVVSVAAAVNLCVAYTQAPAPGVAGVVDAYRRVGSAGLFATLTTAIGFGALAISDVPAIQEFGLLAALGVGFSYGVALLVLPPLLSFPGRYSPRQLHAVRVRGQRLLALGRWSAERPATVLMGSALAVVAAGVGVARLDVETDILAQLPPRSSLAEATRFLDAHLGGINTAELLFQSGAGAMATAPGLRALASVSQALETRFASTVGKTFSVTDVLARIHDVKTGTRGLPASDTQLEDYLGLVAQAGDTSPVRLFLSPDGKVARLSIRMRAVAASNTYEVLQAALQHARTAVPPGVSVQATGQFVLIQNMTHALPRQQRRGLVVATICIVAAIGFLFRSVRYGLLAALPASVPILGVYGIMGWSGIPLSTATSMIATVVLGLAVDSTLLFLARYRAHRARGESPGESRQAMLASVGRSVTVSNVTLMAGFTTALISSFPPVRDFGLLSALTIGASFVAAYFMLPSLLRVTSRWERGETDVTVE